MITDDEIKRIIDLSMVDLEPVKNSLDVIQRFIYDKKGIEVELKEPQGQILMSAHFGITHDITVMNYFMMVASNYYRDKFKSVEDGKL